MMDDERGTLRHVAWKEIFPWLAIARSFRLAISPRPLVLSAVAVTLTVVGWWIFGWMFSGDKTLPHLVPHEGACPWTSTAAAVPDQPGLPLVGSEPDDMKPPREPFLPESGPMTAPAPRAAAPVTAPAGADSFLGIWLYLSRPFAGIFSGEATLTHVAYLLLCGLWALAVWAFFGAVIARSAAVRLACDERVSLGAGIQHARIKWGSYFAAPLFPLIGVFAAGLPLLVLGVLLKFGFGILVAGLLWPLALVAGLMMAVLLLGLVFGWPLMWATISAEGTDSFDALSRSYAYVFQRPLHYLFYAVVATVIGGLGWLVVSNFAAGVAYLAFWAASWGSGGDPAAMVARGVEGPLASAGITLIRLWVDCVKLLAVGYLFSYFWTASTAIYFLLRRDVDATEMDEVYLEEDEDQPSYGLPPLKTDSTGAPVADDKPPETPPNVQE